MGTHYKGSQTERAALDAYIKLLRASDSVSARLQSTLDEAKLTTSQFGVLEALYHVGPLHMCDIARKILRSGGNITLVVKNLERQKLVRRERDPEDQRAFLLDLTAAGRKVIAAVLPKHVRALTKEMAALTPAEQAQLATLCRKLGLASKS